MVHRHAYLLGHTHIHTHTHTHTSYLDSLHLYSDPLKPFFQPDTMKETLKSTKKPWNYQFSRILHGKTALDWCARVPTVILCCGTYAPSVLLSLPELPPCCWPKHARALIMPTLFQAQPENKTKLYRWIIISFCIVFNRLTVVLSVVL